MENIDKVADFHRATQAPILDKPEIPSMKRAELRLELLSEELQELEDAIYKSRNLTEVLDALCDLQYILNGTILEFGMKDVFQEAFDEVHASNMSKFCTSTHEAQQSCFKYSDNNVEAYYKKVGPVHVIYRSADDKTLKGINYFEPKLKAILSNFVSKK